MLQADSERVTCGSVRCVREIRQEGQREVYGCCYHGDLQQPPHGRGSSLFWCFAMQVAPRRGQGTPVR